MNGFAIEINAIHSTVILILLPFRRDEVSYQSCNCHSDHDWTLHRTTDNIFIFVSLVRLMESYIVLHTVCNCNYRPQGKVMFSEASVCSLSLQRGDPPGQRPPLNRDPPGQRPLWTETPRQPLQRSVRILLECILVMDHYLMYY